VKYLVMIYYDETKIDALPRSKYDSLVDESLAYDETLRESGHYIASQALQPVRSARTLHVRDGKVSVTDGPFAETKEQLGGFWLIEARDLDEAIQLASEAPPGRYGSLEVRPILELVPQREKG
jgi:hypothetical protein